MVTMTPNIAYKAAILGVYIKNIYPDNSDMLMAYLDLAVSVNLITELQMQHFLRYMRSLENVNIPPTPEGYFAY